MRQDALHPDLATLNEGDWPVGLRYVDNPSTKMDAMLSIVRHHLQAPGLPPLAVSDPTTNALDLHPDYVPQEDGSPALKRIDQDIKLGPDRIVIFLAFPKNNWLVSKVSGTRVLLYGGLTRHRLLTRRASLTSASMGREAPMLVTNLSKNFRRTQPAASCCFLAWAWSG